MAAAVDYRKKLEECLADSNLVITKAKVQNESLSACYNASRLCFANLSAARKDTIEAQVTCIDLQGKALVKAQAKTAAGTTDLFKGMLGGLLVGLAVGGVIKALGDNSRPPRG
jgi:hypothetical protein